MAIPLTLRVYRGGEHLETREYHRDLIKIGSLATAQLSLDDPRVSRIHAVIEAGLDGLAVTDMGSVEGTYLNGKRISKAELSTGDVIVVGDTRIEFLVGTAAEHEETAPGIGVGLAAPAEPGASAAAAASGGEPSSDPLGAPASPVADAGAGAASALGEAKSPSAAAGDASGEARPASEAAAAPTPSSAPSSLGQAPASPTPSPAAGEASAAAPSSAASSPAAAAPAPADAPAPAAASPKPAPSKESPAPSAAANGAALPQVMAGRATLAFERPIPWPTEQIHRSLALDMRFFWGDKQLTAGAFGEEDTEVIVGSGEEVTFEIEAANLPADSFALAKRIDGAWHLRFGQAMEGELVHQGEVHRLADLVRARKATPAGDGLAELEIPADGAVWVDLGNIRAEICYRPRAKQMVVPLAQRIDYRFMNLFLVVFALTSAGIISFNNAPPPREIPAEELFSNQARFTRLLFTPPQERQRLARSSDLEAPQDGDGLKAPGEEGKAGRPDAPQRSTRSAPRAVNPDDPDPVANQGILAMLGGAGSNSGLSTIFGQGGLGGDLKGAIGGLSGSSVGDAHGLGGLGLKGTGLGGGGEGTTVGVGAIGTKGRGGGIGDYGAQAGNIGSKKQSAEVQIDNSSVRVVGYDPELVRRVVAANRSQLRYCYEVELVRNPALEGRIAVSWTISSDGSVSQASLAETSMNNARVESCLLARVRGWQFPPPKGGGIARVNYPFVFTPPTT